MSETTTDVKFNRVMDKLENINDRFIEHTKQDSDNFTEIQEKLSKFIDKLDVLLLDSEKGLVIRVDRLQNSEQRRSWLTKTAIGAGVTSILGQVWQLIKS